jgi:hypothetical protein
MGIWVAKEISPLSYNWSRRALVLRSEVCKTGRFPPTNDLADFYGFTFVYFLAHIRIFFEVGK